jgi:hypothetical protein
MRDQRTGNPTCQRQPVIVAAALPVECRDQCNSGNYDGDCRKTSRMDLSEARRRKSHRPASFASELVATLES